MVTVKILLCIKEIQKRNLVSNCRPITCLRLTWKLLTGILAEELYKHLKNQIHLHENRRDAGRKPRKLIDKMIVKYCKGWLTSLVMTWIDYCKACDMVPHSWIQKYMEIFGVAANVRSFVNASTKQRNTELTAGNQRLENVKIKREIFQGDSLSPLLFVLRTIPLTLLLRQTKASHKVKYGDKKINNLLFMDDLKLFAKREDQMDSLANTMRIFSEDIKMEFRLPKCGVLIMKRGKVVKSEGINMPDGKLMKNIEAGGYKYLGILEADGVKHKEIKGQIKKEYIRIVRNILKSKLNGGKIISAINSRAVSIVRYGVRIISWTKMEFEELDRKTRKLMTIYGTQYPKADVDRLCLQRCEGRKGLIRLLDCVQIEVHSLEQYLSSSKEKILKELCHGRIIENNKYGRRKEAIHKNTEKCEGKPLHGQFRTTIEKVRGKRSSPVYKKYKKCGIWRKCSIHLSCMICC